MKNMILLIGILLTIVGCNKEEEIIQEETTIFGTWQLIERFDGGSPAPNQAVEDGYTFSFNSNLECSSTHLTLGCPMIYDKLIGHYSTTSLDNKKAIIIKLNCPILSDTVPNVEFYYNFEKGKLILTPTLRVNTCFEGCAYIFKKISNEIKQSGG